jgi:hypothetical protein
MTDHEFAEWFEYHSAAFTGIPEWLAKRPSPKPTLDRWCGVLRNVNLFDAKLATDRLFAQEDQPRGFDRHPAAVAAITRKNREPEAFQPRRIIDGQESFRCLLCEDDGRLTCWHPEQIKHYRSTGKLSERLPNTCSMSCTCAAGEQHHGYGKYNPRQWLPYLMPEPLSENVYRLLDFLKNSHDKRRERAFDAFAS